MNGTPARLTCGTAEKLPFESGSFDLVCTGFCLYLLDRRSLLQKALSEADRVLKPGGFLAITDFDPGAMHKRPYSHREGVFSYKQDYARFYTEGGLYYLVCQNSPFPTGNNFLIWLATSRCPLSLLYKEQDPYPPDTSMPESIRQRTPAQHHIGLMLGSSCPCLALPESC